MSEQTGFLGIAKALNVSQPSRRTVADLPKPLVRTLPPDVRGSASVEFALLLPLLMLILLGAIDFGRFAYASITVTNAARAGAAVCNYATTASCRSSAKLSEVIDVVQAESGSSLPIASADICPQFPTNPQHACNGGGASVPSDCIAPCLAVTVRYPFSTLLPMPHPVGGVWVWDNMTFTIAQRARMTTSLMN